MKKYLWLAVTPDEYELPMIVEDSSYKLAKALGIHQGSIAKAMVKGYSGRNKGRKIVKVEI